MDDAPETGRSSGPAPAVVQLADAIEAEMAAGAGRADPLAALSEAARLERLARTLAQNAAAAAIHAGMSWSDIGAAYGISKQAAHQRFARHVRRLSKAGPESTKRASR